MQKTDKSTRNPSILIVEDDYSFSLELQMMVEEIGCQVAGLADNSASALEFIFSQRVDLILMDIDIKGKLSGIDIGQRITHLGIPILYITSFDDESYYKEALNSHLFGYLVKPVDKYTLRTTIGLSIAKLNNDREIEENALLKDSDQEKFLFVRHKDLHEKVLQEDIVLVEGADDYVEIWTKDGKKFLLRKTMKAMEATLNGKYFFRVHRSYIINLKAVEAIDFPNNEVDILNRRISISRQKRSEFEKAISKLQ